MKTRIILGIVACALFLSTQAFALDPWVYIRKGDYIDEVFQRMGFPDKEDRQKHSGRKTFYYRRINYNGKRVTITFVTRSTDKGYKIITKRVQVLRGNPPVW